MKQKSFYTILLFLSTTFVFISAYLWARFFYKFGILSAYMGINLIP